MIVALAATLQPEDFLELKKTVTGVARRIYPFDAEPETWVDMITLADSTVNRIYDRHKYMPGQKGATMSRATLVLNDVVCETVSDWNGFTSKGVPIPCDNETKLMLLDAVATNLEGEPVSLWVLLCEKKKALEEADAKN